MKRIILIAAACAALASCTKTETEIVNVTEPVGGTSFEKGQTVTLTVYTPGQTKVTSAADATSGDVNFKWEEGDKILVKVGETSAKFTLKTGAGEASATFEGTMPGSGDSFDVQFPSSDPDLSSQTYVAGGLPHNMMKFAATGCTTSSAFELKPQYSALRLNLYGSTPIGKIVVSDGGENPKTYTLTCGEPGTGITLGATDKELTPFFIVVPVGSMKFTAKVFDNALTPESICKFEPSAAQDFSAANVLNMPAKEVKYYPLSWVFSVSSTYKVRFSKGNLRTKKEGKTWTWGFYDNQYDVNSSPTIDGRRIATKDETEIDLFTWGYGNWSTTPDTKNYGSSFTDWGTKVGDGNTWRTLTKDEWSYLINNRSNTLYRFCVSVCGESNCLVLAPDDYAGTIAESYDATSWESAESAGLVCLPAAGHRGGSNVSSVGEYGYYWSSTAYEEDGAYRMLFSSLVVFPGNDDRRNYGCSVRLVSAAQ